MSKRYSSWLILALVFWGTLSHCSQTDGPIRLHPENPHYFLWRSKPVVLVGSTEHYGAVLNSEFDFNKYLNTLQQYRLNLTRIFTGIYCEHDRAFGIEKNTLAPAPGKLIAPWARSEDEGYSNGGNKFDLSKWDEAYFERLKAFLNIADQNDVVVELVLFCPFYGDEQWNLSPVNIRNNINGIGAVDRTEVFTLRDPDLTEVQEEMVRKIVTEVNGFHNLYFEICNEPYFAGPTLDWQKRIAQVIRETESSLKNRHMIAQNIANNARKITDPDPSIDLFNFHYAFSAAVDDNYHLERAIGDDETGFAGTEDRPYRQEAWNFMISGGALFNHLDYSFTVGHEDGSFQFPSTQPGGGGTELRRQFSYLKSFLEEFDLVKLKPMQEQISRDVPVGINIRMLGTPGSQYAFYVYRKQVLGQNFSLRWTSLLTPEFSEKYTFHTVTDDGVRLWVDEDLLIDDWNSHAPAENSGSIELKAGIPVRIRMEYFQGMGGAVADLMWSSQSQLKESIQEEFFQLPDGSAPGLKLEWFDDINLEKLQDEAVVFRVGFNGSLEGIFPTLKTIEDFELGIQLPAGNYQLDWIDPVSTDLTEKQNLRSSGGEVRLKIPTFEHDLAGRLIRVEPNLP